ncbi:phospholipid/cholesterol/gamma-HCH transport system substrate-binding protein [Haloechinothrix alba]|uniref:Phospholipid/cholesterol/gamma-HCH transport system substrate-binding protein n=1 Tax=Haloechinothrix alba TaxID=664784 RepID=A0A239AGM7_9PSEU|nr:MlaD family protein [Haloechinothrix alba]SNR94689.1 phospholipid/cholesterol/gamma-HCH transport system substrate-binding protein [Haloechinothrix alba]
MKSVLRVLERVRNVPGLGRYVIALAIVVALGLAATGYAFSRYGWDLPWQDSNLVAAEFEKAPSIRPESRHEVRIAGVRVGTIVSAEPQPNGNARVVMSLDPGHKIYTNARAVLRTKAPVDIMYVALDPGGPPGKPLSDDGAIPVSQTKRLREPWETLNKLDERAQSALTSLINQADAALAGAPQHLPKGLRATDATMATFRPVVEQLQTRRENIAQLVTSLAQISAAVGQDDQRLARLTSALQQALHVLANRDDELSATLAQVPGLTKDLRHAMTGTSTLTKQLSPTLDALHASSEELPPALSRLSQTVKAAGKVVEDAAPVVEKAKPVVADLRPLASDINGALGELKPVTGHLPSATKRIVPWMEDLAAFVYQTSSAASLADKNGGLARSNIDFDLLDQADGAIPDTARAGRKAGN